MRPFVELLVVISFASLMATGPRTAFSTENVERIGHLGKVHFPTSCSPQVEGAFDQGVAMLHSFQYDLARKVFDEVARKDPHCAMAYWGQAMSLYHPLWVWPSAKTLQQGHADIDTAEHLGANTDRERAYIQDVHDDESVCSSTWKLPRASGYRIISATN